MSSNYKRHQKRGEVLLCFCAFKFEHCLRFKCCAYLNVVLQYKKDCDGKRVVMEKFSCLTSYASPVNSSPQWSQSSFLLAQSCCRCSGSSRRSSFTEQRFGHDTTLNSHTDKWACRRRQRSGWLLHVLLLKALSTHYCIFAILKKLQKWPQWGNFKRVNQTKHLTYVHSVQYL